MIINRNLVGDETLAPEKLCTVLLGILRLKVTMKYCKCQEYTGNLCLCATDCIRLAQTIYLCNHAVKKIEIITIEEN